MSSDDEYYSDKETDFSDDENVPENTIKKTNFVKPNIADDASLSADDTSSEFEEDDAEPEEEEEDEEEDDLDYDVKVGGESEVDEDEDDAEESSEDEDNANKPTKIKVNKAINFQINNDDDEDDDEYDENYLQKFDSQINNNYITNFHPECLSHNSDEVIKLAKVVRDDNNMIIDPLHKTLPYLTKYEKARILGQRAKQIENGSKPFVKVPDNVIDGYIIAELELREKKIPFIIKRPIPGGAFEYWHLNDLENIGF